MNETGDDRLRRDLAAARLHLVAAKQRHELDSRPTAKVVVFVMIPGQIVVAAPFIFLNEQGVIGMRTMGWMASLAVLGAWAAVGLWFSRWRSRPPAPVELPPLPVGGDLEVELRRTRLATFAEGRRVTWEPAERSMWGRGDLDLLAWGLPCAGLGLVFVGALAKTLVRGKPFEAESWLFGLFVAATFWGLIAVRRRRARRRREMATVMNELAVGLGGSWSGGFGAVAAWLGTHWPHETTADDLFAGRLHHAVFATVAGRPLLIDVEPDGQGESESTNAIPSRALVYVAAPEGKPDTLAPIRVQSLGSDFTTELIPGVGLLARASAEATARFEKNPSELGGLARLVSSLGPTLGSWR